MRCAASLLAVLVATPGLLADVLTVGPAGDHPTIAAAVLASADGDTVLVDDGVYGSFSASFRSISIVADTGATVVVQGRSTVHNLQPDDHVLVSGLTFEQSLSLPALDVHDNEGGVRVEDCTILPATTGFAPVVVERSANVAFTDCVTAPWPAPGGTPTGDGPPAVRVDEAVLVLQGCSITGGRAGSTLTGLDGATGGPAVELRESTLHASGCVLVGGRGGPGGPCSPGGVVGDGGRGGFAVRQVGATVAESRNTFLAGGPGGDPGSGGAGGCAPAAAGPDGAASNAPVVAAGGLHRAFDVPVPVREGESVVVTLSGQPGDLAAVLWSLAPGSATAAGLSGRLLLDSPLRLLIVGPVPASGELEMPVVFPSFVGESARVFTQAIVQTASGTLALGEPATLVILDESF